MTANLGITFPQGTLVRLVGLFTRPPTAAEIEDGTACDADDWQPMDPDAVEAKVKDPSGAVDEYAYLNSPGGVERDDVGQYHVDVTPDDAGKWYFQFVSFGNGQAANEHWFMVAESAFP